MSFGVWVSFLACHLHLSRFPHRHACTPYTLHHYLTTCLASREDLDPTGSWVPALLRSSLRSFYPYCCLSTLLLPINLTPHNLILLPLTASSTMSPPIPTLTKLFTPLPWPAPTPATCPDLSQAVWLVVRSDSETHPLTFSTPPESRRQSIREKQSLVRASRLIQSHPSHPLPPPTTHNAPLHAFCQRIPMVVASVVEAEYAAAFGGGQVLVELTLTLTNLGHPQQSPPLLFFDNGCAIGLATSSVGRRSPSRLTCV